MKELPFLAKEGWGLSWLELERKAGQHGLSVALAMEPGP